MPYQSRGKRVYVKKGGKWILKATAKSIASAKRMVNLLRSKKHGKKRKK
jgi:hypothetical protein